MGEAPPKKLVLVVDDDASIRTLVSKALTAKGYEVVEAKDGMHASELLGSLPRQPALVILDVMMPTIDGFSLARMIKSRPELNKIPIIFLTARTHPRDLSVGMSLGARHYIQKPFSLTDLVDKVEKAVR